MVLGDYRGAEEYFRQAAAIEPGRWDITGYLGKVLTTDKMYTEAADNLQASLQLNAPESERADLYYHLGLSLQALNYIKPALKALRDAEAAGAQNPDIAYRRALLLIDSQRWEEAEQELAVASVHYSNEAELRYQRGRLYLLQGKVELAYQEKTLEAFRIEPARLAIRLQKALCSAKVSEPSEAIAELRAILHDVST